ncbi:MAG: hypothetical protein JSU68_04750, partial [Phycisphaerales bacterium]
FTGAEVSGALDSSYRLCVPVCDEARRDFAAWCDKHAGENAGIIFDGQLVRVLTLGGPPPHLIEVATYCSWEEAIRQRDALREGGTN